MTRHAIRNSWTLAFSLCLGLSTLAYCLSSGASGTTHLSVFAWILWPGVALYVRLNGSLLFGGGLGSLGNAGIVIGGSAVCWCVPLALLLQLISRFRRGHQLP